MIARRRRLSFMSEALSRAWALVIHLRLHFQLFLAPIFLWGFVLAGGEPDSRLAVAFLSFHVFLYGGATAFNSYYDRDEGPVGGLAHPPPVVPELLPFSIIMQAIGAVFASLVNGWFLLAYILIFVLFTAYSHPVVRLKSRPWLGLMVVAVGQGVLAGFAGALVQEPSLSRLSLMVGAGVLAAAVWTTGFYPITQVYQIEEDRKRGDTTFAVLVGPAATFIWAQRVMTLGCVLLMPIFLLVFGSALAVGLALFCAGLLIWLRMWARQYDASRVLDNHRIVTRLQWLMTVGFLTVLCLKLARLV